jgi:long-subunit acyl-CoA synthetase (AMP-forming)
MNLYKAFSETSQIYSEKIAIVCEEGRFTYGEFQKKVDLFASSLESISIRNHFFRFGLLTFNKVNDLVILFAAAKLGLEILVINPDLNQNQIEILLKKTGITILITQQEQSLDYTNCVVLGNLENSIIVRTLKKHTNLI